VKYTTFGHAEFDSDTRPVAETICDARKGESAFAWQNGGGTEPHQFAKNLTA
jgi:hypothetical protein